MKLKYVLAVALGISVAATAMAADTDKLESKAPVKEQHDGSQKLDNAKLKNLFNAYPNKLLQCIKAECTTSKTDANSYQNCVTSMVGKPDGGVVVCINNFNTCIANPHIQQDCISKVSPH